MLNQSTALFNRAIQCIPGGVNSPVRAFGSVGGAPKFISSAEGAYITDVDGQRYLDFVGSWGPMLHGHNHPVILQAVIAAAKKGLSFGAPCAAEVELAEWIVAKIPSVEQIRMMNSGTEATMTALRLARGVTNRHKIIKFEGCYHGHSDALLVKAGSGALTCGHPSSLGVPECATRETLIADFNHLDSVEKLFAEYSTEIAAIIVEPIAGNMNMILPKPTFLSGLRALCDHYGALLIFDEVMTGFRVHPQGMQVAVNIRPDLTCFGKVIGGGMPVGALGGKKTMMQQLAPVGSVYQAGTLSGNPVAMAAGLASLKLIEQQNFSYLETLSQQLVEGMVALGQKHHLPIRGHYKGGMFGLFFNDAEEIHDFATVMKGHVDLFNRFFHAMLEAGFYFAPSMYEAGFVSFAHTKNDIQKVLETADGVFASW
ncbi:MAG: glutamate-1-semialdehyde-2,1-aminomutase [Gammaproteobacteria bacterium RIFCSPHIGHO2_12_FULL_41_15]|nr:MAG: glutamate-1-semialdehyde-2,1-aminomutase [Gammaproteobacteria bacterium RIFCSPHIGHO2_12_FULL_41_15]